MAIEAVNFSDMKDVVISNSQDAMKLAISEAFKQLAPFLEIIGGLIGLYIILKIIQAVSDFMFKRRVKRMDKNLGEILEILKNRKSKKKGI
ncbi:hypothetical protein FJZ19_04200 [Candidatus Pacearchaeota archaeon]|nr:hypothetical protein [Candidatus Pacearchaeota archaeon]